MLINEKTWSFIRLHANDDVHRLALQGAKDADVDIQLALQQIAGRQTAQRKLPTWAQVDGIVYPPHLNMEQCSSEPTARYKAQVINRHSLNGRCVDLTGGFGVDFYWISQGFQSRCYVEQNEQLCAISSHNFALLGLECSVNCCTAATYLANMPYASLVFMDPARRNVHGGRTYSIEDCSPNILELLPLLLSKADSVMLKLSPMLDWRKAVEDLKYVSEVHIVSVDNECKELLLLLNQQHQGTLRVVCRNNDENFEFVTLSSAQHGHLDYLAPSSGLPASDVLSAPSFLYEPNASIMKAGCFAEILARFPVRQVSNNSHLFLSSVEIEDFPGRRFQISSISSMNKLELRAILQGIERANISVRNFPMSVDLLRKKLKLKDGGDTFIFATTMANGAHQLFICRKIG